MNLAEAANLVLTLQLKDQVSSGLQAIERRMGGLNTRTNTLQGGLGKISQGIGRGLKTSAVIGGVGIVALWRQVDQGIDSLAELEDVTNQTNAVIESTGGAAGLTADEIRTMAESFEDLTTIDDKVIQGAQNVLLTFTKIKEDAFEPATQAILDMSVAMDMDLESAALAVGKALNDPIKGMTALQRAGVTFTDEQKEVIRALVETGDMAGAQRVILGELATEFGGSSTAAAAGYRGTQERLKDTFEDLRMAIATAVLPALEELSKKLNTTLKDPEVIKKIKDLGKALAGIFSSENIDAGMDGIKGVFNFLKELPWNQIRDGLSFAAENAKKVVDVFRSLPPGVQAGLLTFLAANKLTGGLVASGLGELVKVGLMSLKTITATSVTVIGPVTGGAPGVPGVPVTPRTGASALLGALGPIAIGAVAAVTIDQLAIEQAKKIAGIELDTDAAVVLASTPFFGSMANAVGLGNNPLTNAIDQGLGPAGTMANVLGTLNDPTMGFFTGMLGPGVRDIANELGIIGDEANGKAMQTLEKLSVIGTKSAEQINELQIIKNHTQAGLGKSAEQIAELKIVKNNLGISNVKSAEQINELQTIRNATLITSKKDLSVDVTVRTSLQVSAREIANSLERFRILRGELEF